MAVPVAGQPYRNPLRGCSAHASRCGVLCQRRRTIGAQTLRDLGARVAACRSGCACGVPRRWAPVGRSTRMCG